MTVERREQCPSCMDSGKDNFIIYDNGSRHCYSCGYHEDDKKRGAKKKVAQIPMIDGLVAALPDRNISDRTCRFYDYKRGVDQNGPVSIINYKDNFGNTIAQKIKGEGKRIYWTGDNSKISLYGRHLYAPNDNTFITVTEGEEDALAVAQTCGTQFPVVSVPNGAAAARKAIKENLDYLIGFKHVVLCFDSDEAGRKATQDCVDLFEPGKVKVAHLPLKDACDMLKTGQESTLKSALFNAQEMRPDGIVALGDLREQILAPIESGDPFPWPGMNNLTNGVKGGQLIIVMGGTGTGKTDWLSEIALHHAINNKKNVGIMSFEQQPVQTAQRLIGKLIGVRLHKPGAIYEVSEVDRALGKLEDKVFLYQQFGAIPFERVKDKLRYYVKAEECKLIILDNLTSIQAALDMKSDERRQIDKIVLELASLTHELGCTILLACHLANPTSKDESSKTWAQGRMVRETDARGSGAIGMAANYMIGLERNKLAEDPEERNILTVRFVKDRESGDADGCFFKLRYDKDSGRLVEYQEPADEEAPF